MNYPWKRYWLERGEKPPLNSNGFLYDPEHKYEKYRAKNLKTLDQLEKEFDCLILLGEPGIGKTNELKKHYERTQREKMLYSLN